jgi:hypothetical protein
MSFKRVTIFDAQAMDVPVEVKNKVRRYWMEFEDPRQRTYFYWFGEEEHEEFQIISDYIRNNGENPDDGSVLVHYW